MARTGTMVVAVFVGTLSTQILGVPGVVHAYNLEGCQWPKATLPGTKTPIIIWNDDTANYTAITDFAVQLWNQSGAAVQLSEIGQNGATDVTVTDFNYGNTGFDGITSYSCLVSGKFVPNNVTAAYNTYYTNGYNTSQGKAQVMVHELGHAIGLAHNNPALCAVPIMYYSSDRYFSCGIATPQTDDIAGANAMYQS